MPAAATENQPSFTARNRPWTRWWWHGCAVDEATLTALLEQYRDAGLGGVEITCIYGVKGEAHRNIEYLSPRWQEVIQHTLAEAKRLGMAVDLVPGAGWRMGGPFVDDDAIASSVLKVEASPDGNGYVARLEPTKERVKRAGPGGEGRAFNPFSRRSLEVLKDHFTPVFQLLPCRAQFHDSWEYESTASPELFERFCRVHGYEFRDRLPAWMGDEGPEAQARIRRDMHVALSSLAVDFISEWASWCHELGQLSRNQAHGTPGDWLDCYAAADIPETEIFRNVDAHTPILSKFASSAAHFMGRRLVSSETGTWFGEHFHVSLDDLKRGVDALFVAGINHHFYHGTAYSPPDAPWPGWLFYASTHVNPQNPLWRDLCALNTYITRCQQLLQEGVAAEEILLYMPMEDVYSDPENPPGRVLPIEGGWFRRIQAMETAVDLWRLGYCFDFVSARQLQMLEVTGDKAVCPGGRYRAIVVPMARFIDPPVLEKLIQLQSAGVPVIFEGPLNVDVPGLNDVERRREWLARLCEQIVPVEDVPEALKRSGIEPEPMAERLGLRFNRRRISEREHAYFIWNPENKAVDGWTSLAVPWEQALLIDPLSGHAGLLPRRDDDKGPELRLQLEAYGSCLLRVSTKNDAFDHLQPEPWPYREADNAAMAVPGPWEVTFIEGGPELPQAFQTPEPVTWETRGGAYEAFAGTARYTTTFEVPGDVRLCWLEPGAVHWSARVRLDGAEVASVISGATPVRLPALKAGGHTLEIEVSSLAANRIRALDRGGVEWRRFEEINFVNIDYQPFDASGWPLQPGGLAGPVRLIFAP